MNKTRKWYIVETELHSYYYKDKDIFQPFDDDCLIDDFKEAQEIGTMLREKGYQTEIIPYDIEECNSADFGTLGFMFEAEAGRNKIADLEEENRVLQKAFRNLIEEYLSVMNYINGDSLKVTKKEIDEDFDDRIQQAKESKDE